MDIPNIESFWFDNDAICFNITIKQCLITFFNESTNNDILIFASGMGYSLESKYIRIYDWYINSMINFRNNINEIFLGKIFQITNAQLRFQYTKTSNVLLKMDELLYNLWNNNITYNNNNNYNQTHRRTDISEQTYSQTDISEETYKLINLNKHTNKQILMNERTHRRTKSTDLQTQTHINNQQTHTNRQTNTNNNNNNWYLIDQWSINKQRDHLYNDHVHYVGPLTFATLHQILNIMCPKQGTLYKYSFINELNNKFIYFNKNFNKNNENLSKNNEILSKNTEINETIYYYIDFHYKIHKINNNCIKLLNLNINNEKILINIKQFNEINENSLKINDFNDNLCINGSLIKHNYKIYQLINDKLEWFAYIDEINERKINQTLLIDVNEWELKLLPHKDKLY